MAEVSSGDCAKETLKPTEPNASAKPDAAGSEYAGLAPWIMTTPTSPPAIERMAASMSAYGRAGVCGPPPMWIVRPKLPATWLRISAATCAAVAPRWCAATLGPSARLGPVANWSASSRIVSSSMPAASAAARGS